MSISPPIEPEGISAELIHTIRERLEQGKRVRRNLVGHGRLHIDRQLPFLCIYRTPTEGRDTGTAHLVVGEASYLIVTGDEQLEASLSDLVKEIVHTLSTVFGAFLLIEVWTAREQGEINAEKSPPLFKVITPKAEETPTTVKTLVQALKEIVLSNMKVEVELQRGGICSPPDLPSLLTTTQAHDMGCLMIGLEVRPFYRNAQSREVFPALLRALQRELSKALHKSFFEFMHVQTTHRPQHYQSLGRRAMVKAVWDADRSLAVISGTFDFLLGVTPINIDSAWNEFQESHFEQVPDFQYRLLSIDPELLKRRLYNIPIERVEDPTLAFLFRDKRSELERQITMLDERDTKSFLYGSLQLYGGVDDQLMELAQKILGIEINANICKRSSDLLTAAQVAELAREEIDYYQQLYPAMTAKVHIRSDVSGLMVSRGDLLIGQRTKIAASRVQALLQHEVGTHLLTYYNGRAQPFRQLYSGLAGYDEFQEGLAVLAEYMVDGLSYSRLRLLAARVIAVHQLIRGASFIEIFRELHQTYGFEAQNAFGVTTRVYRGGGLTKDAVYLRGLVNLLRYLSRGGDWAPLFVGKVREDHIPIIRELQWREVLRPIPLQPRYLSDENAPTKLKKLRDGLSVFDLML
jgi:uncharacterized protein (TIGR02421 family)